MNMFSFISDFFFFVRKEQISVSVKVFFIHIEMRLYSKKVVIQIFLHLEVDKKKTHTLNSRNNKLL
jgi:hypothetical protein